MTKNEHWRLEPRVSHHKEWTSRPIPRSLHRQPVATIVLSCIPEGVHVPVYLLGYVEKLRYVYHDVMDMKKFLEFTKKFYL
jgi:hypothetical protein